MLCQLISFQSHSKTAGWTLTVTAYNALRVPMQHFQACLYYIYKMLPDHVANVSWLLLGCTIGHCSVCLQKLKE